MDKLKSIAKTLVAVGGALAVTGAAFADGHVDAAEAVAIASAWAAVLGVYHVTNVPA